MVQLCKSLNAIPPSEAIFSTDLPSTLGLEIFHFFQIVPRPASLEIRSGWDAGMAAILTAEATHSRPRRRGGSGRKNPRQRRARSGSMRPHAGDPSVNRPVSSPAATCRHASPACRDAIPSRIRSDPTGRTGRGAANPMTEDRPGRPLPDHSLEPRRRRGRPGPARGTPGPGRAVRRLLVPRVCPDPSQGPRSRRRARPDPGLLRPPAGEARAGRRRPPARGGSAPSC